MTLKESEKKSVFDAFINRYSLQKTLRFELRPVGNTQQMLIENHIIELDKQRKENYEKTKPFFDKLHREFINESLDGVALNSLNGYLQVYEDWKNEKDKKIKKEKQKKLDTKEKEIRDEIVTLFDTKAAEWIERFAADVKMKKKDKNFLFEKNVFSLLQKKYGDDPEAKADGKSIFFSWDKWAGYFKKFFETRENFYKSDGTSTAVPTRAVNDNLRRFCDNLKTFEAIEPKIDLIKLEKESGFNLKETLDLSFYNTCLNQAGINNYNRMIGGSLLEDGTKVKGINEYVNEYRQMTKEKLPRLKKLDKQIGSDKETFIEIIEDDDQFKGVLKAFVDAAKEKVDQFDEGIRYLFNSEQKNLSAIYFRKEAINTITRRWFANYEKISLALIDALKQLGDKTAKFDVKKEEYKFSEFISWEAIRSAVERLAEDGEPIWKGIYYDEDPSLKEADPWEQFLTIYKSEYERLKESGNQKDGKNFTDLTQDIEQLLVRVTLEKNDETTEIIKSFADRALNIYQFAKYFALEKSRQWNPDGLETDDFYAFYDSFYGDAYVKIVKAYDKIRNYVTRKPFNQNKWVLNFENPTLADGWDKNKESDNTAVILRKDDRYYLGIMDKKNKAIFKNLPDSTAQDGYEKMEYKLFPDPAKMMPKVCFSGKGKKTFKISDEILRIYKNSEFKNGDNFSVESMQKLIDFYKEALNTYEGWKMYNFSVVKPTSEYRKNIGEFYRDVAESGYKVSFEKISDEYIHGMNGRDKLYLFEVHNKDWNLKNGKEKDGTKNLHTLYFEQVFSKENEKNNFIIKLNGEAELFFRPATDEVQLGKKKDTKGRLVTKNKRYSEDKLFFHVPITLNRISPKAVQFNRSVNELLADNPDINIIGIDRGEKHLAYLSVINQKGNILEIKSLNEINGVKYAELLEKRAEAREKARRDWKSVEQIKDLKKGYVSNVIREIVDLIIKYNAIVVLEDLNMRFKQVRGGIEKSVYQQLEKALIDKLNFLADKKEIDPEKAGHILHAYQLTAPFTSFKEMYKQTGILFYTQAEYTSQTDPVTGFRKNIYISNSAPVKKIQGFVEKFDAIAWDDGLESYCFEYDPVNFVDKTMHDAVVSKAWRVYADVPRIKRERKNGYWETVPVNPNAKFKELLQLWEFDDIEGDIKEQIFQMADEGKLDGTKEFDGKKRNFWQSFIYLLNLVLQLRNSTATQYKKDENGDVKETIEGVDFIASPVKPFFCTDGGKYTDGRVDMAGMEGLFIGNREDRKQFVEEFNGDANGAYNIARKGIMLLNRIKEDPEKPDLFIGRSDWDKFTQSQWNPTFKSQK